MTELMWVRSHVQLLLEQTWPTGTAAIDEDGDFPFRGNTAAAWVRVIDGDPPMVRVFAWAANGVRRSAKLLTELNDIQTRTLSASVFFAAGQVVVQQTLSPIGLTRPVLTQAMDQVLFIADDVGPLITAVFDGTVPFPPCQLQADDSADSDSDPR